jgi:hypothetical protein
MYITRKDLSEAGALADFMANVVESTHEETLRVLAAVDVKEGWTGSSRYSNDRSAASKAIHG